MKLILVVLTTGAPGGTNSTIKGTGHFVSGGVAATANSGLTVTMGGTSAAYDHSGQPVDLPEQDPECRRFVDDAVRPDVRPELIGG
jgi:hypothetical protein